MRRACFAAFLLLLVVAAAAQAPPAIPGFRDPAAQARWEQQFLQVPAAEQAGEHLRILTAEPNMAGTPGARRTAEYVAGQYRKAGLETEIVEYRVWMNHPREISVVATLEGHTLMRGPRPEQAEGDPFQDDPRIVMPFNGYSPSGEVEAEVVYANYARPEDFDRLAEMGVDVRGRIVLARYGQNFRGVKAYVAEERGAAGLLIYSDPMDDGYFRGTAWPAGPWRPPSGVQRGSILYIFNYPGDPTTPGKPSLPNLDPAHRTAPERAASLSKVPTTPLSYADASPILENLGGKESPREWQGALPFTYRVGPGPVRVRMKLEQDYQYRSIWNVIGRVRGAELPGQWVIAGNHRDAWVFGAVDPSSGTAAQLEAVRGIGALLKAGWRPRRTLVFASWDAEEQGLIGSTEWVEHHSQELASAAAYFNLDSAVSGESFGASAVPSLKPFMRQVAQAVPSPKGGTVHEQWLQAQQRAGDSDRERRRGQLPDASDDAREVRVGNLGSGSDYTPFLQHLGVPSTDMGSHGPYGVYHSAFDNFAWFTKNADPEFRYLQQMARVHGLQMLRMANADVLPHDYTVYAREVGQHIDAAEKRAREVFGDDAPGFAAARAALQAFADAAEKAAAAQRAMPSDAARLNRALAAAERALLLPGGLPNRPWFRHAIYAPGQYTGYAAVVLPGVNEAIGAKDAARTTAQLAALTTALLRAADVLQKWERE
jgi:N-acetylated-alpha-linked acidic dipeptidase